MPSKEQHLAQGEHNTNFYLTIDRSAYSDWAATVLFYVALQYIDAFLATKDVHPSSHDRRDNYVNTVSELRAIAFDYFRLKTASRNARYYPQTNFTTTYLDELDQVHLTKIRSHLLPILS